MREAVAGARPRERARDPRRLGGGPALRALLAALAVVLGAQLFVGPRPLLLPVLLTVLGLGCLTGFAGDWGARPVARLPVLLLTRTGVLVSLLVTGAEIRGALDGVWARTDLAVGVYLLAGLTATALPGRAGRFAFAGFLALHAGLVLLVLDRVRPVIDVAAYLHHAAYALLHGHTPYGGSVPNPYDAAQTAQFLTPSVVHGDRITVGYPYLPGSLVPDLPGYLAGDLRWVHLVCLLAVCAWARRAAVDETGRALSLLVLVSPLALPVVTHSWVEPVVLAALATAVAATRSTSRPALAAGLAFLLSTKQYLVTAVPLLFPLARARGLRAVAAGVVGAGVVVGGFWLWGPAGFWNDVVAFQLDQPYRPESTSLLVALGDRLGRPADWVTGVLPLAVGLATSVVVARSGRGGQAVVLAAGTGLSILLTALASKQAFTNYFELVQGALVVAVAVWPRPEPADAPPLP
ncbi:MAG: hypothetical protein ACXVD0_06740 [Nocardioides sp.]